MWKSVGWFSFYTPMWSQFKLAGFAMSNQSSLRELEVLRVVSCFGCIAKTTRCLGISAGPVSQLMMLFEEGPGLSLTLKVGKGIRLTAAG
jgi:LysR family glycine cleavage system transcriptional activator